MGEEVERNEIRNIYKANTFDELILDKITKENDHNVDQQSIPSEQNTSKPEGGKPSLDNMDDFKYLTAIYVVIMWCTYMMDGMDFFALLKDGPHFLSWNTSIRLWNACHER